MDQVGESNLINEKGAGVMEWIDGFYSRTGEWWGGAESGVTERDHRRLVAMQRLCGADGRPLRVLDLGSSYGNTAFVMAQAGHDVTGVEVSSRIDFAARHDLSNLAGSLRFVRSDFYAFKDEGTFDVVCYWNGFGVGNDADQRRLLRRMKELWLKPEGVALIEVANPARWMAWAGDEEHRAAQPEVGYPFNVSERTDYDPAGNRFIDTWWQTEIPGDAISQSVRCYSPVDFLLLLEGTGLRLAQAEVDGARIDLDGHATSAHPLWTNHEYLVVLEANR